MTDRIITNSELRTFQLCRRKWMMAHAWQLVPRDKTEAAAGVMHLGSSIHLALEAYYGYDEDPVAALTAIYQADINSAVTMTDQAELEKEHALALVMLEGYLEWVASEGIDAAVEIIGTEVTVAYPITSDVIIRGRLDQLARRKSDGALLARDLKTVGTLGKAQLLRISSQLKFYSMIQALAAKKDGNDTVSGGEYLLLLRSKRTDRATPPFYQRVEVPVNRHDLNSQYMMTMALVTEIESARARLADGEPHQKVAYPHFGDWCGWSCPFKDACPLMDDGSRWVDMIRANFVKQDSLSYYSDDRIRSLRAALSSH